MSNRILGEIGEVRTLTNEELLHAAWDIERRSEGAYTVCETVRELYSKVKNVDDLRLREELMDLCVQILAFTKRMDRKLTKNKLRNVYEEDTKI